MEVINNNNNIYNYNNNNLNFLQYTWVPTYMSLTHSRCKEIICWEGDHETGLSGETSGGFPQHSLDSTIVSFPMLDDEDATKKWMRFKPYPQSKL